MKKVTLLTASLIALGLVSSASASGSFGWTNIVYVTGSTAFRGNVFSAVTAPNAVFQAGTIVLSPAGATGSTSQYNVTGLPVAGSALGTNQTMISFDFTGSEAGIYSLYNKTTGYQYAVPLTAYGPAFTATLPGTPLPTFIDPGDTGTSTQVPDLAFADTSFAVSLSSSFPTAPVEYGTVGAVTFTWMKGANSTPDSSWNDLTNVTTVSLPYELAKAQKASFYTSQVADTDPVYLVGRNLGSGTRVNTLCELNQPFTLTVKQYVVNNAASYVGGVLTFGANVTINSTSTGNNLTLNHLVSVGNDGFDAGSGVAKTLGCNIGGTALVTLGYVGMSDAATAAGLGAKYLQLDGNLESNTSVIEGDYAFWGHEHLYGAPGQAATSLGGEFATILAGTQATTSPNLVFSAAFNAPGSVLQTFGGLGDNTTPTALSSGISGAAMKCDKPSGGDYAYPSQF